MKKLLFILFVCLGWSVQNFASIPTNQIGIIKNGKEPLKTALVNSATITFEESIVLDEEKTTSYRKENKLFECWIYNVHCDCVFL